MPHRSPKAQQRALHLRHPHLYSSYAARRGQSAVVVAVNTNAKAGEFFAGQPGEMLNLCRKSAAVGVAKAERVRPGVCRRL